MSQSSKENGTASTKLEARLQGIPAAPLQTLAHALDGPKVCAELQPAVALLRRGDLSARGFADWTDDWLARSAGRQRGAHSTPSELADFALSKVSRVRPPILDPACGTGHLLLAARERLGRASPQDFYGWDVCAERVQATRIALWLAGAQRGRVADYRHIVTVDAILESAAMQAGTVVANPPFMSIRQLFRECGADYVAALRRAVPALEGNFDLYAAFLLRLRDWLAPDGAFGLIVPATFWTSAYATAAREHLVPHIAARYRFEGERLFPGAAVHTHVVTGEVDVRGRTQHFTVLRRGGRLQAERETPPTRNEPPVGCIPLAEVAQVQAGTPGYHAHAVADQLTEAADAPDEALPFLVTRSVDRYRLAHGPIRFLGRRFERAMLPVSALTPGKRQLFESPKVLVAGICQSLEAARDQYGVAMGVGIYAVVPTRISSELVVALLNSECVSRWYRRRFRGRELSGGYFGVNCRQLRQVPVPRRWVEESRSATEIADLVRLRERARGGEEQAALDTAIDELVGRELGIEVEALLPKPA